jgi:hypothetical protein
MVLIVALREEGKMGRLTLCVQGFIIVELCILLAAFNH